MDRVQPFAFILVVTLFAGSFASVGAQDVEPAPPASEVVLADASGDVDLSVAPKSANQHVNASQNGQGQFDHLDLLKASIGAETDKTFQVTLQLKVPDPPQNSRPFRYVTFDYGRVQWQVFVGACPFAGQQQAPANSGCLRFKDPGGGFRAAKQLTGTRDDGAFAWTVEKQDIFNENRVPARYGSVLTNLTAVAVQYYAGGGGFGALDPTGGVSASDRAPPTGSFSAPFVFRMGAGGSGHLVMNAPEPVRVTNGEATTIVYKVELANKGPDELTVQVTNKGGEKDWSVRTPPILKAPAGETIVFPVILSLPFRHDHGKTALFDVEAQAVEHEASRASTQLGVFWTDVPQPSGHHECDSDEACGQWFHSAPFDNPAPDAFDTVAPFKTPWFNGVAKDPAPNADDANVPAFFNDYMFCTFNPTTCEAPPQWESSWFFPMSPSLLMGLDFDISKQGMARLTFLPSFLDPGARIQARLMYCDPTKQGTGGPGPFTPVSASCYQYSTLLGEGSATAALSANTPITVEISLKMEQAADLIEYQRGANIGLDVRVFSTLPQNTIVVPPRIEFVTKQSHLHMPLLEYHDPVDQEFAQLGALKLEPIDPFEKPVNPGRTAAFRFEVKNEDAQAHHVALEVQGVHAEWASIVGPKVILVEPGQKANFSLAVAAPDDAVAQERAELFVVAQSQQDASIVAMSRLRATVVTQDVPDESGLVAVAEGGDGPSPGLLLIAAALLVGASLRRRRA